jgi:hypothetical protein
VNNATQPSKATPMRMLAGGLLADRFGKINRRHVMTAPAIGFAAAVPLAISPNASSPSAAPCCAVSAAGL